MPKLDPADPRLAAPNFPHGEQKGYTRGCRCDGCREGHAIDNANRRAPTTMVGAHPVAEHIGVLLESGLLSHITRASGLPHSTLQGILERAAKDPYSRVRAETSAAILAVTPMQVIAARAAESLAGVDMVRHHLEGILENEECTPTAVAAAACLATSTVYGILDGTRERLQIPTSTALLSLTTQQVIDAAGYISPVPARTRLGALRANGWSIQRLSKMLGYAGSLEIGEKWITPELDARIAALYEKIGDRPGGNQRVAESAAEDGFRVPIHYDDDMTLITDSIRNEVAEARAAKQEKARESLRIMGYTIRNYSATDITKLTGATDSAIQVARRKVGLKLEASSSMWYDNKVRPGQDEIVALIADCLKPIRLAEPTDALDDEDLDYAARWKNLARDAQAIRSARPRQQQSA